MEDFDDSKFLDIFKCLNSLEYDFNIMFIGSI